MTWERSIGPDVIFRRDFKLFRFPHFISGREAKSITIFGLFRKLLNKRKFFVVEI